MTFGSFIVAVDLILKPFGIFQIPKQERPYEQSAWKTTGMYAFIIHYPKNNQNPARLGFADVDTGGLPTATRPALFEDSPLKLDMENARFAAERIIQRFGVGEPPG
jgi:hypothetical protein